MGHSWAKSVRSFLALCTVHLSLYLCAYAESDQGKKKVTLIAEGMPRKEVFAKIEKQTGLRFFYSSEDLKLPDRYTIRAVDKTLDEVLGKLLLGYNLEWEYNENVVVIRAKKKQTQASGLVSDSSITSVAISGKVTEADGAPIIGATVMVKGTTAGATTDSEGIFTVLSQKKDAVLLVRSIGYETREVPIKGNTKSVLVKLNLVVNDLDETVVIAYGTTTKRYSTGNISTVKAKDIEKQPVNNPLLALQGRVPGLFITQTNGIPGGGVTVRIQGQNSIGNGNDPLYVIDGVPYVSQMLSTTDGGSILGKSGGTGGGGNPLSYINPADIESIEVLKDADATAIYGSRAANGAILITTKKGQVGTTKVNFNVQQGWGKTARKMKLMNTAQYLEMRREALKNDGILTSSATDYDINGQWDTTRYTDWQRQLIGGTAQYTNVNGSISGGSSNIQYLLGGTYHRETVVFPGNFSDQKGSVHFNINSASPNGKFRVQLTGNYLVDNNELPLSDVTSSAITLPPNAPALYNEDGSLNWALNDAGTSTWNNPLSYTLQTYQNQTNNLIANTILSYEVLSGLEIKSSFGYNRLQTTEFTAFPLNSFSPESQPAILRYATYSNSTSNSWIIEPQVTYRKAIGNGKLDLLIGTTIQHRNSNGENLRGEGYNSDAVLKDIKSAANVYVNSSVAALYKYNALFGRVNYNWRDKYIINLSARRDGSSRFGENNQFQNFGAIGFAWLISEEKFVKNAVPFLSFAKLKGSYGTTGNDQIGDYMFLNLYSALFNLGVPYQGGTGLIVKRLHNPYLQWEETRKLQFGIDIGILKDRIMVTANYVRNRSSNQLLNYNLPSITGFTGILANFPATVQNTAWEFTLDTKNVNNKSFSWNSSMNLTIPKNELVSFPGLTTSSYADFLIEGEPISILKAFRFLNVDPTTGIYQFLDSEGKTTSTPDYVKDRTVLINTLPKFYGGFENSFHFKGLQLDIFLQFVKQINSSKRYGNSLYHPPGRKFINQPVSILDRWQKPGDIAPIQRYNSDLSLSDPYDRVQYSDVNFEDASYIRLKNLSLSYDLPEKWNQRMKLSSCRIYIQGQNLITMTNFSGLDPETGSASISPLRVLTVGLKVGL